MFRPRYLRGHRVHHGLAGFCLASVGVALVLHDWLWHGDGPRSWFHDFRHDRPILDPRFANARAVHTNQRRA